MIEDILIDDFGCPLFIAEIDEDIEHDMKFHVYKALSWNLSDNKCIDKELYLSGNIKWDGCSHIDFGDNSGTSTPGYLHFCGKEDFKKHAEVLNKLFKFASENIENFDKTEEDDD